MFIKQDVVYKDTNIDTSYPIFADIVLLPNKISTEA